MCPSTSLGQAGLVRDAHLKGTRRAIPIGELMIERKGVTSATKQQSPAFRLETSKLQCCEVLAPFQLFACEPEMIGRPTNARELERC